ncbi:hypothetical protein [Aureispira anguillae]|uniref:Uncharacterized protein n=1 Tax=Aureispira anguillae TaxID=2864201 RepID=A0A915YHX9_9BACT|nr:hypothetical protein [Aureispira anguillae]BDS13517.1 hypothetical protein AsAng_0042560 [Aureispira anguillae]
MIHSKFIRLYQTLSASEHRLLKQWVLSPIHNQRKSVVQLFDFIYSRSNLTAITLQKERAFSYIFPKETYDMYKINHVISYAYKVLEEFIEYLESVSSKKNRQKNKISAYSKRNSIANAKKIVKKSKQDLLQDKHRGSAFYLHAYELEVHQFNLEGTHNRIQENNLPNLFSNLSNFFILSTLRYAYIAASHSNVYKVAYEIPMLSSVLEQAQQENSVPVIQLYYFAYMALTHLKEECYYLSLKKCWEKHGVLLQRNERQEILLIIINYAIKQAHSGNLSYIKEAFQWYQVGLRTELLVSNGQLSQFAYKNIVALGLKLKAFDWIKTFIKQYTSYLPKGIQLSYENYVLAKYFFEKNKYDACLSLLTKVEYDDLFMNIDAKMMLLKIYYKNKSWDALEALIQSFKVFLQRKEVMSYHKHNYLNILSLVKKIILRPSFDQSAKEKLYYEIESMEPLTEKQWLLDQLNES